ncbi:MAG: hypothetical protein AMK73_03305 [Planctomycetes bacterium SM23_32]|nr:MAG: hypothetical protein AMK73_03305 [Planctomycetes bacterium SM23_32]
MGCVLTILALMAPRLVMVLIVIFTDWFSAAYATVIWPLLGFFFMPYTTLAYMAAMLRGGGVSGGWLALVIVAAVVDVGHWGHGGRALRRRP